MVRKKRFPYWLSIALLVAVGTASWAFYNLINQAISDLLANFGIENFYAQNIIVVFIVLGILLVLGYGGRKSLEKILGK